jgi:hypothetical protein
MRDEGKLTLAEKNPFSIINSRSVLSYIIVLHFFFFTVPVVWKAIIS